MCKLEGRNEGSDMNTNEKTELEAYRRDSMFWMVVALMMAVGFVAATWT